MPDLIEIYQELLLAEWKKYLSDLGRDSLDPDPAEHEKLDKLFPPKFQSERDVKKAS